MGVVALTNTKDMDRTEWLKWRNSGIGGSDAAIVAGISKYKSPVGLWLEKTGQVEPEEAGEAAYWGTVLEELVAKEFSLRTGLKIKRDNFMRRSEEHPFMIANIDRKIIGKNQGLECKTASAFLKDDWEGDNVPDAYYIQVQHYIAVYGFEGMHIAVLIGGNTFVHKYVPRNDEFIQQLVEIEKDFWQHITNGTMPPVDGSESSSEALKKMYPEGNGQATELPDTAELWIKQWEKAKEDMKEAEIRKDEAENALKNMLGSFEKGRINNLVIEWKSTSGRKTFDSKRFEKENPSLYSQYVKIGEPSRRFSVKG